MDFIFLGAAFIFQPVQTEYMDSYFHKKKTVWTA